MVTIKLGKNGGYVYGDGDFQGDPDRFFKAFAHRIIDAQRAGMQELQIPDEEVQRALNDMHDNFDDDWDRTLADTTELPMTEGRLLNAVDARLR